MNPARTDNDRRVEGNGSRRGVDVQHSGPGGRAAAVTDRQGLVDRDATIGHVDLQVHVVCNRAGRAAEIDGCARSRSIKNEQCQPAGRRDR